MTRVAIIGAGLIGRAWAISFARAGYAVALWDEKPGAAEAAKAVVATLLPDLAANDLLNGQTEATILGRIAIAPSLEAALAGADYVQENTPEDLAVKQVVFARLDALAPPEAILASSTSAILPSKFTENLAGRARCLIAHPINPPYLIPAVEIVPAPWTSDEAMRRAAALMREAGHAPIVMRREIDGFIMNRLQGALLEEAFRLVDRGYASAEDVDIGLREGLALRWSFMGPFETIDLNAPGGVRDYVERYQSIYENIFPSVRWRADWAGPALETIERERRAALPVEELQSRALWRDRRLMALLAHKRRAARDIRA